MIMFTRLNRSPIALNPDLIERVEANPDTVITLVDDKKVLVTETMDQVIALITDFRAYVISRSRNLEVVYEPRPTLHLVPNETVVSGFDHDPDGTDPADHPAAGESRTSTTGPWSS